MADATDLKSVGFSMRVRVPPRALGPKSKKIKEIDENLRKNTEKSSKKQLFFPACTIKRKNISLICNDVTHQNIPNQYNLKGTTL